jgi:hypothetical protein
MKSWLRTIRGVLGMGVTWAIGWGAAGALFGAVFYPTTMDLPLGPAEAAYRAAMSFGSLGFIAGGLFSVGVRIADGRRRFDQLAIPRFAAWGAVGGCMLGGLLILLLGRLPPSEFLPGEFLTIASWTTMVSTLLGAASAAGTLAIARRSDDHSLLEASEEVGGVGLSEQERQSLLGPSR